MTITLPDWVFDCLDKYGNCALPKSCVEMDRKQLIQYLESKTGHKINIKESSYHTYDKNGHILETLIGLIAEEM